MENKDKIDLPSSFEINTISFVNLIKENEKTISELKYNLAVYASAMSEILNLNTRTFNKRVYISLQDVVDICNEYFKRLNKNEE